MQKIVNKKMTLAGFSQAGSYISKYLKYLDIYLEYK